MRIAKGPVCLFWGTICFFFLVPAGFTAPPHVQSIHAHIPLENLLTGMAIEPSGSLLVLENDSGELSRLRFNPNGDSITIDTVVSQLSDPIALALQTNGALFIAERQSGRILRLQGSNLREIGRDFADISTLRLDDEGNLWITELEPGRLIRFNLKTHTRDLILEGLEFPSDVIPLPNGFAVSELVDRSGTKGRVSIGDIPPVVQPAAL
ncbi:MAG TPA: hypothetical protein PLH79_04430, partial [bacterium]|nr:hypothetical protein [bacterium]